VLDIPAEQTRKIIEDVDCEREREAVKMRPLLSRRKNGDDGDGASSAIESKSIAFAISAS
jgi:hypothetical protein